MTKGSVTGIFELNLTFSIVLTKFSDYELIFQHKHIRLALGSSALIINRIAHMVTFFVVIRLSQRVRNEV